MDDEELGGGRIRIGSPGHRDDAPFMLQQIVDPIGLEFAFDGVIEFLADEFEGPALDHEILDDPVEHGSLIKPLPGNEDEIGAGVGGGLPIKAQFQIPIILNVNDDHNIGYLSFPRFTSGPRMIYYPSPKEAVYENLALRDS